MGERKKKKIEIDSLNVAKEEFMRTDTPSIE